ncbi:uncharacterized protein V1477_015095, partial [Vespula maculifrons]
ISILNERLFTIYNIKKNRLFIDFDIFNFKLAVYGYLLDQFRIVFRRVNIEILTGCVSCKYQRRLKNFIAIVRVAMKVSVSLKRISTNFDMDLSHFQPPTNHPPSIST